MESSDFTLHEIKYLSLFNEFREKIPLRDVTVFRQSIKTREDLLNTIFFTLGKKFGYTLASSLRFTPSKAYQTLGRRPDYYDPKSYPFYKFKSEKDFSDLLCAAIVNYIPFLTLPNVDRLLPTNSIKDEFLRHYTTSIGLLLRGPPHANEHDFNEDKKEEWIRAQKTDERRNLARLLLEKTIYISHSKLLSEIKSCVEKVKEKLEEGPVTFIVGTSHKSNYYISLLFYHYWNEAGLPLDYVKTYMDEFVYGNLIDIDEMAYSGTQTTNTLAKVYGMLIKQFHSQLIELNAQSVRRNTNIIARVKSGNSVKGAYAYNEPVEGKYVKSFASTVNFLPVWLVENYLSMKGTNYIVLRIFCSEKGLEELTKMPPKLTYFQNKNTAKPPFYLVIGQILPSPETLFGKEKAYKLSMLFGHNLGSPAAPVYFNHKIANLPSTYLFPLSYGVVPNKILSDPFEEYSLSSEQEKEKNSIKQYMKNLEANPEGNAETVEFIPFVRYCGPYERFMPTSRKNLLEYQPPGSSSGFRVNQSELPQEYRCPYAWYKGINYDTATYTPPPLPDIPLPYGPRDENFLGGKRKYLTRKQKNAKKQKVRTRKH